MIFIKLQLKNERCARATEYKISSFFLCWTSFQIRLSKKRLTQAELHRLLLAIPYMVNKVLVVVFWLHLSIYFSVIRSFKKFVNFLPWLFIVLSPASCFNWFLPYFYSSSLLTIALMSFPYVFQLEFTKFPLFFFLSLLFF